VLSIGSNVGDRLGYLQSTVDDLRSELVAVSPVYQTPPWGGIEQDDFLNAVLIAKADLAPFDWLRRAQQLERAAARLREVRWGPRTLDVDIVAIDDLSSDEPELTLPHPRAHERAFVLVPWADVEPDAILPGYGPVRDLLRGLNTTGITRTEMELT
jgi:2-amino-4-hydroxy-6-hydroxymethyldihydropteridine diphosphokinase